MRTRLMQKVEEIKQGKDWEPVDIRSVQWDGSDKDIGKYKVLRLPEILAKKVKFDGVLLEKGNDFCYFLKKGDYLIVETYKDVERYVKGKKKKMKLDIDVQTCTPKKYKQYYKEVD